MAPKVAASITVDSNLPRSSSALRAEYCSQSGGRGTLTRAILYCRIAAFKDSEGNDIQLYEAPKN